MSNAINQPDSEIETLDAVVVGAGLAGLYQLYSLLQRGLKVRSFEAAQGVGGVWYWNRYPGARVDSHFPFYQYWFSKELWNEAQWKERFPGQVEIENYLNHVCDKFQLRRHITFGVKVTSAHFDEPTGLWTIETDGGHKVRARFLVLNTGGLFEAKIPDIVGHDRFQGLACHTSHWPKETVELAGKRVAVIGTAATGIQVVQTIAPIVGELFVLQRTPNYAVAMHNPAISADQLTKMRQSFDDLRTAAHNSFGGFVYADTPPMFDDVPEDQREAHLFGIWNDGSLKMWGGTFADSFINPQAAQAVSAFVRARIRERIKDPAIAQKLIPTDYDFGTRRVPLENGYFDAFNRDNVHLVDLREEPIVEIDATGIKTTQSHLDVDVIIYATGFDAGIGAINRIDIRNGQGLSLKQHWAKSLRTTVGMTVHGFPNLFMTMAPFAPAAALCNYPVCADQQVDWISDAIHFALKHKLVSIGPKAETEAAWMAHHEEVSEPTLLGQNKHSWYRRQSADGTARELIAYVGGIPTYRLFCDGYRESNYAGFDLRY